MEEPSTGEAIVPVALPPPPPKPLPAFFDWSKVPVMWTDKYGQTNLAKFHHYQEKLECQDYFITWNFNYAISSCIGRKLWIGQKDDYPIFANLFLFFVGPPGASKSLPAVKTTQILSSLKGIKILKGTPYSYNLVHVSPDSATLEALYDHMVDAAEGDEVTGKKGALYVHSSVSFCLAEEVGVLFKEKTNDLIMFLTAGWNCGNFKRKIRSEAEINIVNMCVNFLGCCTPRWYRDTMATKLINEGFTGRVLHIYGARKRWLSKNLNVTKEQQDSIASVKDHLSKLAKLVGEVTFTPEAKEFIEHWCLNRYENERINKAARLDFYYERKRHHLYKMCIIAHFHNKLTFEIDVEDVQLAMKMLNEIEPTMHLALQEVVNNKISTLASDMLMSIANVGSSTRHSLVKTHFTQGTMEEIEAALKYLCETGDIKPTEIDGKQGYTVVDNDANESLTAAEQTEEDKLKQMIVGKN